MKRPFTLLCLADLHYGYDRIQEINDLARDLKQYCLNNKNWEPDYLVIAGDVIDWTDEDRPNNGKKYNNAKKGFDSLIKALKIDKRHVVMIPGNHDNTIKGNVTFDELNENAKVFEECLNKVDVKKLESRFKGYFEDYINFAKHYSVSDSHLYSDQIGKDTGINISDLKYLSGVKAFKDDNLCFVMVNTEWLYVSDEPFKKEMTDETKTAIRKHMKLYEKCQLFAPFVNDAYSLINEKYQDYVVVSLLHRGFDDLTWGEKNVTDRTKIDAIGLIKKNSQIILTGHDHSTRSDPPTLLDNKVQWFSLGNTGRKDKTTSKFIHTASLIRIDPSLNQAELLQMEYDKGASGWRFKENVRTYPFVPNHVSYRTENKSDLKLTVITAKSCIKGDVEKAIRDYFGSARLTNTDLIIKQDFEMDTFDLPKSSNSQLIVVWHDYKKHVICKKSNDGSCLEWEDAIKRVREKYKMEFLLGKLSLARVYIDYHIPDRLDTVEEKL